MTIGCGLPNPNRLRAPARFDFAEPAGLSEALALLAERPQQTALLAGGTDLLRNIHLGNRRPALVLSIARLPELAGIRPADDGGLSIGALVTMAELAADRQVQRLYPALAEAAAQVGSVQVRNRATFGGNLVNASPCADSAPPAYVHDARVVLASPGGERRPKLREFMTGPGQTDRRADEILTRIELPAAGRPSGSAYQTLTRRKSLEITIASATARLTLDAGGAVAVARVCLGSVAPTPLLSAGAERILRGQTPSETLFAQAARAAAADSSPIDDLRAQARYRRSMVAVLTRRALDRALRRAQGGEA